MGSNQSYLSNADPQYVDALYQQYLQDPESVDYGWRKFFEGFEFAKADFSASAPGVTGDVKEIYVLNLIHAYRTRGHLFTRTNPVRERRTYTPNLDLANFKLTDADLDTVFQAGVEVGLGPAKLRDIVALLKDTYCVHIGAEFMHIRNPEQVEWLRSRMETSRNKPQFSISDKKHILHKLNQAVVFEKFLHTKFVGQKRFSLEGAETTIAALDEVIETGAKLGVAEFVFGMAHRGRLNVLANILGKTYSDIFHEFEEHVTTTETFEGDVKYHMGFSYGVQTRENIPVHLTLCPNPSHLESVDPVAAGHTRAKRDVKYSRDNTKLLTVLIHGDASIAGQGIVYEVAQMSELPAYETGGTMHIVINNQVGFTTNYLEARSSTYCTDVAKVTQSPVFHVNGDDAEAVVYTMRLAMEFRQKFQRDVYVDLLCYRRWGHNEGDEPRFTQPTLYKVIEKHPDPREIYFQKLLGAGEVEATLAREMEQQFRSALQERLDEVKQKPGGVEYTYKESGWKDLRGDEPVDWDSSPETAVDHSKLQALAKVLYELPKEMSFYDKIVKIFEARRDMVEKTDKLDWAMGEELAYASLLAEGYPVRLAGQDVQRGTFAHRHAVLRVNDSEETYVPLENVSKDQAKFESYNSLLSEYAALGFEYGYTWAAPYALVIWEAQFGDFVNGAQIIIDQYISSAETKWNRHSGLVMLLPHGYEGQGPEHSSARMERFLELAATNNMQIVNPTTPAQIFHLLRRQIHRPFRAPLVVFTPKALLRLPEATSSLKELSGSRFREVIDDDFADEKSVNRVLFCSGKIYYDLVKKQQTDGRKDVAVVRMEQLYPLPLKQLDKVFAKYKNASEYVWVQEEPENMGAWTFIMRKFRDKNFAVISRKESGTPATGYKKQHVKQQNEIVEKAFETTSSAGNGKTEKLISKTK